MRYCLWVLLSTLLMMQPVTAWGDLPLITDDAETQGKGKYQIEIGGEYNRDRREPNDGVSVDETDFFLTTTLTRGITEHADVFIAVPYQWINVKNDGAAVADANGISDIVAGVKWRFFEHRGLSFAAKPSLTLPTGDYQKGLGAGKAGYSAFVLISKDADPWEFHLNLGYLRNENKINERKDIWHASLAAAYEVEKGLKVCLDAGIETDRDVTSEVEPSYLLGGVIYSLSENVDLSLGVKIALNRTETDSAVMPGVTYRF